MAYKCAVCGRNEVGRPGDVCEACVLGEDPYLSMLNGGNTQDDGVTQNTLKRKRKMAPVGEAEKAEPYVPGQGRSRKVLIQGGNTAVRQGGTVNAPLYEEEEPESQVHVYQPGQAPVYQSNASGAPPMSAGSQGKAPAKPAGYQTKGIIKNVASDQEQLPFLLKIIRCLFTGVPLTINNDITTFQVFPDYSGQTLNAMGNACDQVAIHGKVNAGIIAENNEVEVYGKRDSKNVIVASKIKNVASGSTVTAYGAISPAVVWILTVLFVVLAFAMAASLGVSGILWVIFIIICLTNLPLIVKIIFGIISLIFSFLK